MANSISQFISEVRRTRNEELANKLSAALPYMQYEIERQRTQKAYDEQLGRYKTDLGMQITDPDLRHTFENSSYQTMEGAQLGFENAMNQQKYKSLSNSVRNAYQNILDPSDMTRLEDAIASSTNAAELDNNLKVILGTASGTVETVNPKAQELLNPDFYAKYQQYVQAGNHPASALVQAKQEQDEATDRRALSARARYSGGGGGGGGGQQQGQQGMAVTNNYRQQRDKVVKTDQRGTYVYQYRNGELLRIPAIVGNDERLYLVGANGRYEANPHHFTEPPRGNITAREISPQRVDRWNNENRGHNVPRERGTQGGQNRRVIGYDVNTGNPIYEGN